MSYVTINLKVRGMAGHVTKSDDARKLEEANGMQSRTMRASMQRIPSQYLDKIKASEAGIRNLCYNKGVRVGESFLVPFPVYPAFKSAIDQKIQEYDIAVNALVKACEDGTLANQIRVMTGEKYSPGLVPSVNDIKSSFGVSFAPYADTNDPTISTAINLLGEGLAESLRKDIEKSVAEKAQAERSEFSRKIAQTVLDVLDDLADSMEGAGKGKHYKTIVEKIGNVVTTLPAYNIHGDKNAEKLLLDVKTRLGELKEISLKENTEVREKVKADVAEVKKGFGKLFEGMKSAAQKAKERTEAKAQKSAPAPEVVAEKVEAPAPEVVEPAPVVELKAAAQKAAPQKKKVVMKKK
jgi:hypothetical protein